MRRCNSGDRLAGFPELDALVSVDVVVMCVGSARMIAVIASSKLNGQSETGLAFGINPPVMASVVEHSSPDTSSEHAVPAACSAVCYHGRKDIRILAVVMTERELRQVQRQIGFADVVIRAHHATLQQAPEAINIGRVDVSAYILPLRVVHALVRKFALQTGIARMVIGCDQGHPSIHRFADEAAQRDAIRVLNYFTDHVTLTSNRANDSYLAARDTGEMGFLAPVTVLVLTTNVRLVNFYFAHELGKAAILHGGSDPMAHIPGGFIGPAADLPLNLQRTDALLALGHEVNHLEPDAQVIVGILKDGFGDDGEAIAVPSTAFLALTNPVKGLGLQLIDFVVAATRALNAIRPAAFLQELFAGFFRRKAAHELRESESGLGRHGLASVMLRPV